MDREQVAGLLIRYGDDVFRLAMSYLGNRQDAKEAGIPTEGSGFRDYIGYFVHNDILYSVMPYGIYDNTIPENYVNGRALTILKHILDSFA